MDSNIREYKIHIFPTNSPWGVIKHPTRGNIYKHSVLVPPAVKDYYIKKKLNKDKDIVWDNVPFFQIEFDNELMFSFWINFDNYKNFDELLNSDYCAVRKPNDIRTYYYTLSVEKQGAGRVKFNASLDVFFTFHPSEYLSSTRQSFIRQGHEKRFLANGEVDWKKVLKNKENIVGIDKTIKQHILIDSETAKTYNFSGGDFEYEGKELKWAVVYINNESLGDITNYWKHRIGPDLFNISTHTIKEMKTFNDQLQLPYSIFLFPVPTAKFQRIELGYGNQIGEYTNDYLKELLIGLGSSVLAIHLKNWDELGLEPNTATFKVKNISKGDRWNGVEVKFNNQNIINLINVKYITDKAYENWLTDKDNEYKSGNRASIYLGHRLRANEVKITSPLEKTTSTTTSMAGVGGIKRANDINISNKFFKGIGYTVQNVNRNEYNGKVAVVNSTSQDIEVLDNPPKEDDVTVDAWVPLFYWDLYITYLDKAKSQDKDTGNKLLFIKDIGKLDVKPNTPYKSQFVPLLSESSHRDKILIQPDGSKKDPILFHPNYYQLELKKWNTQGLKMEFPYLKKENQVTINRKDNKTGLGRNTWGKPIEINTLYSWEPANNTNIVWANYENFYKNALQDGDYLTLNDQFTLETHSDSLVNFRRDNRNAFNTAYNQQKATIELERRQARANLGFGLGSGILGIGSSIATGVGSGSPVAGIGGALGSVYGGLRTGMSGIFAIEGSNMRMRHIAETRQATIDDLQNRLGTITTGETGHIDRVIGSIGDRQDELKVIERGLSSANETILLNEVARHGYKVVENKNVKDFMRTRERFNYVEADGVFNDVIDDNVKLSSATKQVINDAFADGITFWHYRTKEDINDNNRDIKDFTSPNDEV